MVLIDIPCRGFAIEIDDGEGAGPTTNYVIKYESQFFFVIHWTDVPNEIFDFRAVRGY